MNARHRRARAELIPLPRPSVVAHTRLSFMTCGYPAARQRASSGARRATRQEVDGRRMHTVAMTSKTPPGAPARREAAPALAAWALGFVPVFYLALSGGGYDPIVRGQAGIVVWWIVLLVVLTGVASLAGLDRWAWLAIGLLAAFAVWVGLASGWSESAERSVGELGRVAALLGFFGLGLLTSRRR